MDDRTRRPGGVPDLDAPADPAPDPGVDVRPGSDTDGDGEPDTLLTVDGTDLLVATDLDGDGLADRLLRIGPDGAVHRDDPDHDLRHDLPPDDPAHATGSAPAHSFWSDLFGAGPETVGGPG